MRRRQQQPCLLTLRVSLPHRAQGKAVDVVVHLDGDSRRTTLQSHRLRVVPDRGLLDALRGLVGAHGVRVRGGWTPERRKPRTQ